MFNRTFPPTGAGGGPFQWWSTFTNTTNDSVQVASAGEYKRTAPNTLTADNNAGGAV